MNWLALSASLVGMLCVMLLWQGFNTWMQWLARHLRQVGSGLLALVIGIPVVWLLPNQSKGIFLGAVTGLFVASAVDAVPRRELRKRAARG